MKKPRRPKSGRSDADRRLRQAARHARAIQVLKRISGDGTWTAKSLAQELECAERTIYRDLAVLELAGVPWYFDESKRGYQVREKSWLPNLNLSEGELLGQATASALAAAAGIEIGKAVEAVTSKLEAALPAAKRRILRDAMELIKALELKSSDHSQAEEHLRTIQVALVERRQLRGTYCSPYLDGPVTLSLNPLRLCLIGQAWYLIAREAKGGVVKTYRAARFQSLKQISQAATAIDEFELSKYLGNAWSVFRSDRRFHVRLRFDEKATPLVLETRWHRTQEHQLLPCGEAEVTFAVDGLEEITRWVLGWAPRVTVLEPPELRSRVMQALERGILMHKHAKA